MRDFYAGKEAINISHKFNNVYLTCVWFLETDLAMIYRTCAATPLLFTITHMIMVCFFSGSSSPSFLSTSSSILFCNLFVFVVSDAGSAWHFPNTRRTIMWRASDGELGTEKKSRKIFSVVGQFPQYCAAGVCETIFPARRPLPSSS